MNYRNRYTQKMIERLKKGQVGDGDEALAYETGIRLSGMKGAEKKMKDKMGRNQNIDKRIMAAEKARKRISDYIEGKRTIDAKVIDKRQRGKKQ